jgi:hypothetical protein
MLARFTVKSGRSGKWRNKFYMTPFERRAFESAAGDTLRALGYQRAVEDPRWPLWLQLFSVLDNGYKVVSNAVLRRGLLGG